MLPTTKARALVAVRKDIESSYQIVRAAVEELAASGGFSLDALNNRLKGAASDTVNTMFRAKIEELKKVGRVGSMLVYDNVLKGLERFAGAHIRFEAVTVSWLGRYADFLRKEGKTQTTLAIHLCNGINVADFVKLRYRDIVNGEICFVRQKTERTTKTRKEIRVVVTERMQAIINRWGNPSRPDSFIFPILDGQEDAMRRKMKTLYITRAINKRMKEVGEQLGIGNISTYTARHSFATVLKRAGTNIAYISESLGHQDLRTTENYLASFEREERIKNAELLTKF